MLPTCRGFAQCVFLALRVLRKIKLIHSDVKPDNILIGLDKLSCKLSDFGSAMEMSERVRTSYLQPRYYRAPEVILGQVYGTQIDVWSAGTTLFEIATGRTLFRGETNSGMLHEMLKVCGGFPKKMASTGEFVSKYFDSAGDFRIKAGEDAVVPMSQFHQKHKPMLTLLETALKESGAPRGVDAGRYEATVRHLADLLAKCLMPDPSERITPEDALAHAFFKKNGASKTT